MQRVVNNAYKLYFKTRENPSPESVSRAKDLPQPIPIHPLLLSELNKAEVEKFQYVESLKSFRPSQTIMEFQHRNRLIPSTSRVLPGSEGSGESAIEIMRKKNYIHGSVPFFSLPFSFPFPLFLQNSISLLLTLLFLFPPIILLSSSTIFVEQLKENTYVGCELNRGTYC